MPTRLRVLPTRPALLALVACVFLACLLTFPAGATDATDATEATTATDGTDGTEATDATGTPAQRPADHVVLISIDGLRPEFYLDPSWPAPMLQQLARDGAAAERVEGVFPTVTYPSHTTMITGVRPALHGVAYNALFDADGTTDDWYWYEEQIRTPTLWDLCREAGLTSASLGWPASVGAPVDWNLPEIWDPDDATLFLRVTAEASTPPGLLEEIEREATGRLRLETFTLYHHTRDDRAGDIASYLLETYRPNLLTVHLLTTDEFQHQDGRDSDRVRRAVAVADRAVAQIWETAERAGLLHRTAFVITGDHGHVNRHTRLAPNVWLRGVGLLERNDPADDGGRGDWRAVFHTTGAAAFLHLKDPGDEEALALVQLAFDRLDPAVRSLFRVVERDELDALGAAPGAALALALRPGIDVTGRLDGPAVEATKGATHGYLPDAHPHIYTGLLASGAGLHPGRRAAELRLVDVAPLVAELLGLELEGAEGLAPRGWLIETERVSAAEP